MKKRKKKRLVIIEKPAYIDGKKVYLMSYHKWAKNKIHLFFIILYCKIMCYKYEVI